MLLFIICCCSFRELIFDILLVIKKEAHFLVVAIFDPHCEVFRFFYNDNKNFIVPSEKIYKIGI